MPSTVIVAGRGTSARLDASVDIGPWMVTWIGVSLANRALGPSGAFAVATEADSAAAARNVQPLIVPSFCSGSARHRVRDHPAADDFEPAERTAVVARDAGIDAREPPAQSDLNALKARRVRDDHPLGPIGGKHLRQFL